MIKFIYSEKATKFCEISTVDLSYVVLVKSTVEISQNFVAFSEYLNFTKDLQTIQKSMTRVILGLKRAHHINMWKESEKIKMLSVNQMSVYHTVLEPYNITRNKSSDQLHQKFMHEGKHSERSAAKITCIYQKTPQKGVQVSLILDRNYTIWYQRT